MTIAVISFWLPLLWALFAGIYWRFLWKEPINNWLICLFVGAVCFFFFVWTILPFILVWIFKSGVLKKLMNTKEDEPAK